MTSIAINHIVIVNVQIPIGGYVALTKEDLGEIKKIVDKSAGSVEQKFTSEIQETKEEILDVLGREISDLADINRAVITRTDELDYRLRIVERKLGLKVK